MVDWLVKFIEHTKKQVLKYTPVYLDLQTKRKIRIHL